MKAIKRCLKKAKKCNLEVKVNQLETQYLCGGDAEPIIDALAIAKENNIDADWGMVSSICLAGLDPVKVIKDCIPYHEYSFDTYGADSSEKIDGYCIDGKIVSGKCSFKVSVAR